MAATAAEIGNEVEEPCSSMTATISWECEEDPENGCQDEYTKDYDPPVSKVKKYYAHIVHIISTFSMLF